MSEAGTYRYKSTVCISSLGGSVNVLCHRRRDMVVRCHSQLTSGKKQRGRKSKSSQAENAQERLVALLRDYSKKKLNQVLSGWTRLAGLTGKAAAIASWTRDAG